ncbi:MAG: outer membrane beta-barrel protein [Pseudomonadota bacterium]
MAGTHCTSLRQKAVWSICVGATAALSAPALAQPSEDILSVMDLPRPGYEPRTLRFGNSVIAPRLDLSAIANSNIFGRPDNEEEDILFIINPSAAIATRAGALTINTDLQATARRFLENTQDNLETFGIESTASYQFSQSHSGFLSASFQRGYEVRTDPEANDDITVTPTLINTVDISGGYTFRPGRFGVSIQGGVNQPNFLRAEDDDRDLTSVRGSIRGIVGLSDRIDFFTEGYVTSRDFRTAVDRTGVNRDGTTFGLRSGIALDITDRLQGDIGIGVFDASFEDDALEGFTGFGASGRLSWRPRARTNVALNFFRGDFATITNGASGRIDSSVGVSVIQEARHNLLLRANLNYRTREFRTAANNTQRDFGAGLGVEYMLTRHVSIFGEYRYRQRNADQPLDEFDQQQFGLTLKLVY